MTPEQKARVQSVIDHVQLRDVVLYESNFERGEDVTDPLPETAIVQTKRMVEAAQLDADSGSDQPRLLQIMVTLGARVVADTQTAEDEEPQPLFVIEAHFLVEYEADDVLDEASIRDFADFNAVHNVWPFWRQHVFDITQRARLPQVPVPLFSATKS